MKSDNFFYSANSCFAGSVFYQLILWVQYLYYAPKLPHAKSAWNHARPDTPETIYEGNYVSPGFFPDVSGRLYNGSIKKGKNYEHLCILYEHWQF